MGSFVILTGGKYSRTTVSEYNQGGWVKDLTSLQDGRYNHGCSYYYDDAGKKVDT